MSVNYNLLSGTLTEEAQAGALGGIKTVEANIAPIAITLPTEEKISLARVGAKITEFNEKAFDYMEKNPEFKPAYIDMEEYGNDVKSAAQLKELMNHLVPLADKIKDSYAVAASEAYSTSRVIYYHVKNAAKANIPGASAIAKELGKLFHRPKSSKEGATKTPENKEK
ncbi:MAG: hypothetical protein GY940_10190 [bacterium]|nr:hypothetical protein [bacterium]